MKYAAILWDCDGCLIDSELVACSRAAQTISSLGYAITTEQFVQRFCGQHRDHIYETIRDECGTDFRPQVDAMNGKALLFDAFRKELKVIHGIEDALDQLPVPMAIASGSDMDRLEFTLKLTNLYDRFAGRIYNATMVPRGKPYPDVFLYAAQQLNVPIDQCLVIEDSANGVKAGKASGATVFGFTGGAHVPDKQAHEQMLLDLGADLVFHDMRELVKLAA